MWGDWEEPYTTLEPRYEAAQLRVFAKLVAAGHIYRRACSGTQSRALVHISLPCMQHPSPD